MLIDHEVLVNVCDLESKSPLFYASQAGFIGILKILTKAKGNVNAANNLQETPLSKYISINYLISSCSMSSWAFGSNKVLARTWCKSIYKN